MNQLFLSTKKLKIMNIIELFENANVKNTTSTYTSDDNVKVRQQFDIEKNQNPSIDSNVASNLILAMTNHTNELNFIANNRILYNFFSKRNLSRDKFNPSGISANSENVKSFINEFLSKDLTTFFDEKMEQNKFDELDDLLQEKANLPQNVLDKLNLKITEKFDKVISLLNDFDSNNFTQINFLKHRSFYDLLTHFKSQENDEKIKSILIKMRTSSHFVGSQDFNDAMMLSMANYKPVDNDLTTTLKNNKDEAFNRNLKTSSSGGSAMSIGTVIIIGIIVIRLILVMVRCNR